MEITKYEELNALNWLLGKIKFQSDLDFHEFKIFVGSPIISEIYERVNREYLTESKKRGFIDEKFTQEFRFDSPVGRVICMRIDELNHQEMQTLVNNKTVEEFLKTLIKPLSCNKNEYQKLLDYFKREINAPNIN